MRGKYGAVAAMVLLSIGCDDPGLRAGTYDLGLAPGFVPFTDERAPLTIEALSEQPLDIVCAQQVWRASDVSALENAAANTWPFSIFPEPSPGTPTGAAPACGSSSLDPLQACMASSCPGAHALARCVIASCDAALASLPPACSGCLAAHAGARFEQVRLACTTTPGAELAFGGSFGLGLMSRYPLLDQDFLPLKATFHRRGVIYARIEPPGLGTVHVFCTHLTPIYADLPRPGGGSWEAEQRAQIVALLDFVASKAGDDGEVLLMGDFHTGPALGAFPGEAPADDALLLTAMADPYVVETPSPPCTFCASNPLVPDDAPSNILDHVLVRGLRARGSSARFLTGELRIAAGTIAYSDHYGVRSTLTD